MGAVLAVLVAASSRNAAADPCERAHLSRVGAFDASWAAEIARVCEALLNLRDRDDAARIELLAGDGVTVSVTLPDGRSTHRTLSDPAALERTLEPLVVLPPSRRAPEPVSPPSPTLPLSSPEPPTDPSPPVPASTPATRGRAPDASNAPRVDGVAPRDRSDRPGVELGALAMGRVSGSPVYLAVGPTAWASLSYARWIFSLTARVDAYEAQPTAALAGFQMIGAGGGFEVARRVRASEAVAVDIGLGAQLLEELQSAGTDQGNQQGESSDNEQVSGESTDFRLLAALRTNVGKPVRFTGAIEVEMSPLRVGRDVQIDPSLPNLPSFGIGLGAGVSWEGP